MYAKRAERVGRQHLGTQLGRVNERSGWGPGCFIKIAVRPARHFSGRGLADRFTTLLEFVRV